MLATTSSMTNLYDMDDKTVEHLSDGGDVASQEDRHRPVGIRCHVIEDPPDREDSGQE